MPKSNVVMPKFVGIVVTGIILGISLLSGCSSSSASAASRQIEIFNILQAHPQIEGVTYMPTGSQNTAVEFTLDGVDYVVEVGYETKSGNIVMQAFTLWSKDEIQLIMSCDCGSEQGKQEFDGTLDGKIDIGQLGRKEDKDFQPYNRYTKLNTGFRDYLQKVHNASLENILEYFNE
jgi:hypothetical protein